MVMKKRSISLFLIIFLFCAIFTPDFFPFSMRYLIAFFCIIGIIWHWIKTKKAVFDKRFMHIFIGFIPLLVWVILAQIIHILTDSTHRDVYVYTLTHTLEVFLAGFLIGLFLTYVAEQYKYSFSDFIRILIIVTLIQFVCVVLALLFPAVRLFFNAFTIKNSQSEKLAMLALASSSGLVDRSYGLSSNLFDSFGFISGLLICLIFIYGMEIKNNLVKVLSFFLILLPLVNSRTGLLLVIVGFVVTGFFYLNFKTVLRNFLIFILAAVVLFFIVSRLPESMIAWISKGFSETRSILSGDEKGDVFSKLFGYDLVFPSSLFLGDGGYPKHLINYSVDNGYINCLWNFGIVGSFFLFMGYINMFRISFKSTTRKMNKAISVVIATIFFVYLFKIYSIDNFGGIVVIFGIVSMIIKQADKPLSVNAYSSYNSALIDSNKYNHDINFFEEICEDKRSADDLNNFLENMSVKSADDSTDGES